MPAASSLSQTMCKPPFRCSYSTPSWRLTHSLGKARLGGLGCLLLYSKGAVKEFFTFFHSPIPIVHQSGFISCFHQQEHTDLIRFKDNFPINDLIFNLNQFAVLTHKHQLQASDFFFHAGNTQTNRTIGLNGFGFL